MGFSNYALMTGRYSVSFLRKILWPVEKKLKGLHKIQPKWEVKLRGAHLCTGAPGLLGAGESLSSAMESATFGLGLHWQIPYIIHLLLFQG